MKKDVVGPMSLPDGAVIFVQNGIDPFSGFQLMPFYTDRQTERQTYRQIDKFTFLYIYNIYYMQDRNNSWVNEKVKLFKNEEYVVLYLN